MPFCKIALLQDLIGVSYGLNAKLQMRMMNMNTEHIVVLALVGVAIVVSAYFLGKLNTKKAMKEEHEELINKANKVLENAKNDADVIINDAKQQAQVHVATTRAECKEKFNAAVDNAFDFESKLMKNHQTAQVDIQKVLDDTYNFKVKQLLKGITLKNHQAKYEQINKEREKYSKLLADKAFFNLANNSDWNGVVQQYKERVIELQEAQDERDAQAEIKRMMKEEKQREAQLEKELKQQEEHERQLEEQRKAIEAALKSATAEHRAELESQRKQLEQEIEDTHKQYERTKSMAQMTKQGHVYVISNIGSFGDNVFKVGMTRRLEPLDRVKELGDASVPFEFDVHAMIGCDDAPALEKALHEELDHLSMNKVNKRKEFFKVDINTIINAVEKHHGTVEYVANPLALQYNRTLDIEAEEAA